jgi:hypothetical protein
MANSRIVNTPSQAIPQSGTTHQQITVGNTAAKLSASHPLSAGSTHVLLQFNGATARVTFDKVTDPTATKGFRYVTGTNAYLTKIMYESATCIREASTDVIVEVQELNFI